MGWDLKGGKQTPPAGIGWGTEHQVANRPPCPNCQAMDSVQWQKSSCGHQTFFCGQCGHQGCAIPSCPGYFLK